MRALVYSYGFYLLANVLDVLSSIHQQEANPLMQVYPMACQLFGFGEACQFDPWKALYVKATFLCFFVILSAWTYLMFRALSIPREVAGTVAALWPIYSTFGLFEVALSNVVHR